MFKVFSKVDILKYVSTRQGEIRLGEGVVERQQRKQSSHDIQFKILGIPEDFGVRANGGVGGTQTLWEPFLKTFLNTQWNETINKSNLEILGYFDFYEKFKNTNQNTIEELKPIVSIIDDVVSNYIIETINVSTDLPIIIGGGHNNAFPIIKAISTLHQKPIHVLNIDAHADLRQEEGRHSGNGFTYALNQNFLGKYCAFGLNEAYNNQFILDQIKNNSKLKAVFIEDFYRLDIGWQQDLKAAMHFLDGAPFGLELDVDVIQNVLSSAVSPTGFTIDAIRQMLQLIFKHKKPSYIHICEGATTLNDGRHHDSTAKLVSTLVLDCIKAINNHPL